MEKLAKDTKFEKYAMLVRKRAWDCSYKYKVDYEEMESQGFLIYCECLEKFDSTRAGFTTYLYVQLGRLRDFARTWHRTSGVLMQDYFSRGNEEDEVEYEKNIEARESSPMVWELLEGAKTELSNAAYEVFEWIVLRDWEKPRVKVPNVRIAAKKFQKTLEEMEAIWDECGDYWNERGFKLYA